MKRLIGLLLLLLAACSSVGIPSPTPGAIQEDAQEQAVYAFLLSHMYKNHGYVIMNTTSTGASGVADTSRTLDYVLQNLHGVGQSTVDSFRTRNDQAYPLSAAMQLDHSYTLLSQAQRDQIFGQNQSGWETFYNRFPTAPGITSLSHVGFSSAYDQALVYIGTQSNWLAGAGYYILLKKSGGAWTIDQQVMVWIS